MSETKFTPGPWAWGKFNHCDYLAQREGREEPGETVFKVGVGTIDWSRPENKTLVAAAPDLYAALELLATQGWVNDEWAKDGSVPAQAIAEAALAKARGEA